MLFLLSNDDGVHAPGLRALERALAPLGRCITVAPDGERSAAGHAFTLHRPLRIQQLGEDRYAVDGSPADAVYVGLHHLCPEPPALVVAGINRGANLGTDTLYSGTVAAALEAAIFGFPALAASLLVEPSTPPDRHHWDTAESVLRGLVEQVLERGLPPRTVLNLNVPDRPEGELRGLALARLGHRHYHPRVERRLDPRGRPYYWIGGTHWRFEEIPGTDGPLAFAGWATVTPLAPDLTSGPALEALRAWPGLSQPSPSPRSRP